jgi:prevent-host-death family protein
MLEWQSQHAKARFSELMRMAQTAPQFITVRGEVEAVMLSKADYQQLTAQKPSLVSFMRASPLCGEALDLTRDRSLPRGDLDL